MQTASSANRTCKLSTSAVEQPRFNTHLYKNELREVRFLPYLQLIFF
jgi:hypothetical protein